jgi:RecB family endonuclease NucS
MEKILEKIHDEHCSYLDYNKEIALSFVVTTAYLYATTQYTIKKEDVSSRGMADFAFYPNKINDTAFIIELKKDKTPEEAIEQIKDRKYFATFKNFKGKKLLVGITYDTKDKKHNVKIEELK